MKALLIFSTFLLTISGYSLNTTVILECQKGPNGTKMILTQTSPGKLIGDGISDPSVLSQTSFRAFEQKTVDGEWVMNPGSLEVNKVDDSRIGRSYDRIHFTMRPIDRREGNRHVYLDSAVGSDPVLKYSENFYLDFGTLYTCKYF